MKTLQYSSGDEKLCNIHKVINTLQYSYGDENSSIFIRWWRPDGLSPLEKLGHALFDNGKNETALYRQWFVYIYRGVL